MKKIVLVLLVCISFNAKAQIEHYEFFKGLTVSTTKDEAVEVTIKLLRNYFASNVNDIQKSLRKEKSIKLSDKNMDQFLTQMEKDFRAELKRQDDWSKADLSDKYLVDIERILGRQAFMIGLGDGSTGKINSGSLSLKFKNNKIMQASLYVKTIYSEYGFSGHSYGASYISEKQKTLANMLGPVKMTTQTSQTWRCSSRSDPEYSVTYDFNSGAFYGYVHHTYDILVKSTGVNQCVADGNHLTAARFIINRQDTNEADFKERT